LNTVQTRSGIDPVTHPEDFISYSAEDRVRVWHKVVNACKWLADDFESVMEHGQMAARLETFSK
jgi:hypothetical protein